MEIIRAESPEGVETLPAFVQFGGQTPLNLAAPLAAAGVPLLGASLEAIDETEDRVRFAALLDRLGILQPQGGLARSRADALALAERIGYPVIVRPSYVIGGLAIDFAYTPDDLTRQLERIGEIAAARPLRIDRFLEGIEIDIDAVTDGETVLIPGLLEHVELAGVHSGDSIAVYPPQRISAARQAEVAEIFTRLVREIGVRGLVNAQFIVREEGIYLIEVNPRASRTVPFMSKVTGIPMVSLAVDIALGDTLASAGYRSGVASAPTGVAVKAPAFSTAKLRGVDPTLGPFMQSTGEVIGIGANARDAIGKALIAANLLPPPPRDGQQTILLSIADRDKGLLAQLAQPLIEAGYDLAATPGTRDALAAIGISASLASPLGAGGGSGAPEVVELIRSGAICAVVNTPSPESGVLRDALEIRLAAVEEGVLCLTTMETAVAAAESLSVRRALARVAIGPLGNGGLREPLR
jgi:carbamoyl-phosphate synthase large subunit